MSNSSLERDDMALFNKNLTSLLLTTNNDELNLYSIDINLINKIYLPNISKLLNISLENLSNYVIENGANYNSETSQREPLTILIIISIFYGIILIAGILGNLITCIVISRNKSMHTATNFYLFNLAISDLILLLSGLPTELYSNWYPTQYPFPDSVCVLESTLLETAANATVLTITAFSVERYIAICHPFRQHTMSKLSRAVKFILAIWLTAFILALPQTMQFSIRIQNNGKDRSCSVNSNFIAHVFAVSGCVFFVGPMTAICALYVLIGVKLKKSRLLQKCQRYDLHRGISAQTRVIRMLIAVAVAFFICWAPFHAQRLMAVYGQAQKEEPSELFHKIYEVLTHVSGVLYFLSTCINPFLYNIMSNKFRNAFKVTIARQFGLSSRLQTQNNNYYSAIRQNGSMRMHTTTTFDRNHHNNIPLLNRESDLSLLQEYNLNNSKRSGTLSNRICCGSLNSQSTILTTFSKSDYATKRSSLPPRSATRQNSNTSDKSKILNDVRDSKIQIHSKQDKNCTQKDAHKTEYIFNRSSSKTENDVPLLFNSTHSLNENESMKISTFDLNLENEFECTCGAHTEKSYKSMVQPKRFSEPPSGSTIVSFNFRNKSNSSGDSDLRKSPKRQLVELGDTDLSENSLNGNKLNNLIKCDDHHVNRENDLNSGSDKDNNENYCDCEIQNINQDSDFKFQKKINNFCNSCYLPIKVTTKSIKSKNNFKALSNVLSNNDSNLKTFLDSENITRRLELNKKNNVQQKQQHQIHLPQNHRRNIK